MPTPTPTLTATSRFAGCLIGQAVGDALGFVVEALPPDVARRYVDEVLRTGRAGDVGRDGQPFGQYTDDTQLARELCLSLSECRRFDPAVYAARIAALFARGRDVGAGEGTRSAAHRLLLGVPWHEAGTPAPYAGNGSAMRVAPLGLALQRDARELGNAARDQSRITHRDLRCSAGSIVVGSAVALGSRPGPLDRDRFLAELVARARNEEPVLASALTQLAEWSALEPAIAAERLFHSGIDPAHAHSWQGISAYVVPSVVWALYAFLRSPDDYWETVCTAIAVGGDTDTMAAIAGAISGARLGLGAVPGELAAQLTDRGEWGLHPLLTLAEACATLQLRGA